MSAKYESGITAVLFSPPQLFGFMMIMFLSDRCGCVEFFGQSGGAGRRIDWPSQRESADHKVVSLSDFPSQRIHLSSQQQQKMQGRQLSAGARMKRSSPQVRNGMSVWDEFELLFDQMSYEFASNRRPCNFKRDTSATSKIDIRGFRGEPAASGDAGRRSPEGARQSRVSHVSDNTQSLSNRQAQEPNMGTDDYQAALSQPTAGKVIETAVFIDQALDNKFTGLSNGLVELNKLVLTIMNQVQYLFEYSGLQVSIKLKLVLVEHLRESERLTGLSAPNPERGDIDAYLSNFCNWQQTRLDREKRLWWDHAILLSGLDLYRATSSRNHSGVLGLAWVGGMCKGNYSCTINEASNFESAFVIAHEIGHSLGIMHDAQKNKCDPNGFIMSERTGAGKVRWSKCSNSYLNESILKGQLSCLDSEQNNQIDSLYDLTKLRAPGQVYTINEQCRLAFGSNYSSFVAQHSPFNAVCRELWCVSGNWAKAAHPALEGSSCGQHEHVCREGKCVRASQ